MLIKIKGKDQDDLQAIITRVMNLACVTFKRGNIPSDRDILDYARTGLYWYENKKQNYFDLLPALNNHKAFIKERGTHFVVVEFHARYDNEKKQSTALTNLVLALFPDEVELVEEYYESGEAKKQHFETELESLLSKYKAELMIEDFGSGNYTDEMMTVDFVYDTILANNTNNGIVPSWIIGKYIGYK